MAVHSTKLGSNYSVGTTPATLYTVPGGKRTIVKNITVRNRHVGATYIAIIGQNGATVLWDYSFYLGTAGASGDSAAVDTWIVMNAGESLHVVAGASPVSIVASGAELGL